MIGCRWPFSSLDATATGFSLANCFLVTDRYRVSQIATLNEASFLLHVPSLVFFVGLQGSDESYRIETEADFIYLKLTTCLIRIILDFPSSCLRLKSSWNLDFFSSPKN